MTTTTDTLPAAVVARYHLERFVEVTDADGTPVRVRWTLVRNGRGEPWRCDEHGPMARALCDHTFAAGLVLADELLGLTAAGEHATTASPPNGGEPR